jgi:hypothetical protein
MDNEEVVNRDAWSRDTLKVNNSGKKVVWEMRIKLTTRKKEGEIIRGKRKPNNVVEENGKSSPASPP